MRKYKYTQHSQCPVLSQFLYQMLVEMFVVLKLLGDENCVHLTIR